MTNDSSDAAAELEAAIAAAMEFEDVLVGHLKNARRALEQVVAGPRAAVWKPTGSVIGQAAAEREARLQTIKLWQAVEDRREYLRRDRDRPRAGRFSREPSENYVGWWHGGH